MERIDCVADPVAWLWALVLAHVLGGRGVLSLLGSLCALRARLVLAPDLSLVRQPIRAAWRPFAAPRAVAAAA